jgi:hypothetical protein
MLKFTYYKLKYMPDQHTNNNNNNNNNNKGLYMQPQKTLLPQGIITAHRIYCIIQRHPNKNLIYFNLTILGNFNVNNLNFKNLCNLARHKNF